MKHIKILALLLSMCMLLSIGAAASGEASADTRPDTSLGGQATSAPPDNSTRAIDILGSRAAVDIEFDGAAYELQTDAGAADAVNVDRLTAPASGEPYTISGVRILGSRVDWDEEGSVGNSGIVINARGDEGTDFTIGGAGELYVAPDGELYNSVVVMDYSENELLPASATETAPGTGIAFNGHRLTLENVYVESNLRGRPAIHIPSPSRDKNVTQYSDLIVADSTVLNHDTRAMLLMGGDVWFLNSLGLTYAWGALSFDNTESTMYVVNSDAENIGSGGYAVYDAAGCTAFVYGSRIVGGNIGITVCRTAELTVDSLDRASAAAVAPYSDTAALMTPSATADGRTELIAWSNPIMMHADMAGADSQASAYVNNAYISTLAEDVAFADGTTADDWPSENVGTSEMVARYQAGPCALIKSHSGKLVFDNCEMHSRTGVLVSTQFGYDAMASGIYPIDGVEYVGDQVVFRNMSAAGDVMHEDYMRKMVLSLENAELTGRVVGTTLAGWNNYWRSQIAAVPSGELTDGSGEPTDAVSALSSFIYNDTYHTVWGVRMSMDAASVWNVTGTSNLSSFTMAPGAVVQGANGRGIRIFVNCAMDNALEQYDITTGTEIAAFQPGVTYTGVVILTDAAAVGSVSGEPSN